MSDPKPAPPQVKLLSRIDKPGRYSLNDDDLVVYFDAVYLNPADDAPRNPMWEHGLPSDPYYPLRHLDGLTFRAQAGKDASLASGQFYGWHAAYMNVYRVEDPRQATAMARTLTMLGRAQEKHAARYGSPQDWETWLVVMAQAIGASFPSPFMLRRASNSTWNHHDHGDFRFTDADGLRYWLAARLEKFRAGQEYRMEASA